MTTKTILTDTEIITIDQQDRVLEAGEKGYILPAAFFRAIEQAVLKSLPVQTSSTIRGDSYAGVYIWRGRDNITQHIPKRLVENESNPHGLLECVAAECVRELEQSVLQSPEVQALQKDAERYRRLRRGDIKDVAVVRGLDVMEWVASTYSEELVEEGLGEVIDAAMENQVRKPKWRINHLTTMRP